jgi:predicted dehydrogenase
MEQQKNPTRRHFVKGAAAVSAVGMPAIAQSRTPSGDIRVGVIGVGIRGIQLAQALSDIDGVSLQGISDISDHYIDRLKSELPDSSAPVYRDYRELLDRDDIDAVIVASSDHWHAPMTLDALAAGKDVYVEKPMTWCVEEALRIRDAVKATGRVLQAGYQRRTLEHYHEARDLIRSGLLGEVSQVQTWSSRNRPGNPPWRAYNSYTNPGLPEKSGEEHVDWERFQANRPARPYDAKRFFHWQCYREYSTGIFGVLMSHPVDAANLMLDLGYPDTCSATGGIYTHPDGRTVPDTCNAIFNYPHKRLAMSFVGCSTSAFYNSDVVVRGTEATLDIGVTYMRIYAEAKNKVFGRYVKPVDVDTFKNLQTQPVLDRKIKDGWNTAPHLQNFFDNVRTRGRCNAHVDAGLQAMACVDMSIKSYTEQRTMHWDKMREVITD